MLRFQPADRFYEPLMIEGGPATRGVFQRAGESDDPSLEFTPPRFVVRVRPDSLVQAGQVVRREGGARFLLAYHSETPDYRLFWCFLTERQILWRRRQTVIEPLSGIPREGDMQELGRAYGAVETVLREPVDRNLGIREEQFRVMTGLPVMEGDELDGQIAKRVHQVLGIRVVITQ